MTDHTRELILAVITSLAQPPPNSSRYINLSCNMILAIIRLPPDPSLDQRHRFFAIDDCHFNATLTAKVISWRSVTHMCFLAFSPVLTQLFFPKPPTTFSHASAEVRGENTPEIKVASTGEQTHNHQVISPTRSSPGRGVNDENVYIGRDVF